MNLDRIRQGFRDVLLRDAPDAVVDIECELYTAAGNHLSLRQQLGPAYTDANHNFAQRLSIVMFEMHDFLEANHD